MGGETRLESYRRAVAEALAAYAAQTRKTTQAQYGDAVAASVAHFLRVALEQTHERGTLVLAGYALENGHDEAMALRAACAVELLHAVITLRRSTVATDRAAAEAGEHAAQIMLANLEVDAEINRRAISIMNRTMLLATHAQTVQKNDPSAPQIAEWQALEHIVNPLHVGMVLAGADCRATDAITPFATELGLALAAAGADAQRHYQAARQALAALAGRWPAPTLQVLDDFLTP